MILICSFLTCHDSGEQDGCGVSDGSTGGHSRHSCMCGQLVWKHGGQASSDGVCPSGEISLANSSLKYAALTTVDL